VAGLGRVVLHASDPQEMICAAEQFFQARESKADAIVGLASELVERILAEPEIKSGRSGGASGNGKASIATHISGVCGGEPEVGNP
jgi:hypothetical protein